jgi:hypothetical protein
MGVGSVGSGGMGGSKKKVGGVEDGIMTVSSNPIDGGVKVDDSDNSNPIMNVASLSNESADVIKIGDDECVVVEELAGVSKEVEDSGKRKRSLPSKLRDGSVGGGSAVKRPRKPSNVNANANANASVLANVVANLNYMSYDNSNDIRVHEVSGVVNNESEQVANSQDGEVADVGEIVSGDIVGIVDIVDTTVNKIDDSIDVAYYVDNSNNDELMSPGNDDD